MRIQKLLMMLTMASFVLAVMPVIAAQNPGTDQSQVKPDDRIPIYHFTVNVVERTTKAINYQHRSGATKIDFRGTALLPDATGEAKVESKQGYIEIEVEFDELRSASRFGHEYLTYVMWAITPEGRATNLGEVILNGSRSKLNVTTELQAFGLIVTAEPYFAVTQPSDVVVMENVLRRDTSGKVVEIEAKYELLRRGQYTVNVLPSDLTPMRMDKKTPLDLYEARNAVRIAQWAGASVYAAESFQKAGALLDRAEDYKNRKSGSKQISMTAREAVQTAEDARLIALQRQEEERLANERAASAERESQANAAAAGAQADADAADRDRIRAEADSAAARTQVERARMDAELAAQRVEREKAEALAASERARLAAAEQSELARKAALEQSELARQAAVAQAEREKQELRNKLAEQLNMILVTRDSARGLIVEMSDVLFDSGKYTLRSGAREKLAKISGIVLAYPGLKLEVEGHTDSVGSDDYNMTLSENRAGSVRDFLVLQGIDASSIATHGFGESRPVTTNETAAGRQSNRRVELVVSGDPIGKTASLPTR